MIPVEWDIVTVTVDFSGNRIRPINQKFYWVLTQDISRCRIPKLPKANPDSRKA